MRQVTIKDILREKGFEPGVAYVLERFSEELVGLHQGMRELAGLIDKLSSVLTAVTQIAHDNKTAQQRLESKLGGGPREGVTLSGEDSKD